MIALLLVLGGCASWRDVQTVAEAEQRCGWVGGTWSINRRLVRPTRPELAGTFDGFCKGVYLDGIGPGTVELKFVRGELAHTYLHVNGEAQASSELAALRSWYGTELRERRLVFSGHSARRADVFVWWTRGPWAKRIEAVQFSRKGLRVEVDPI